MITLADQMGAIGWMLGAAAAGFIGGFIAARLLAKKA